MRRRPQLLIRLLLLLRRQAAFLCVLSLCQCPGVRGRTLDLFGIKCLVLMSASMHVCVVALCELVGGQWAAEHLQPCLLLLDKAAADVGPESLMPSMPAVFTTTFLQYT